MSEMAAAYLFHLCQNHPFVDGNKRAATVAALVFLLLNGPMITASAEAVEELVWAVAKGQVGKTAVGEFIQKHSAAVS